jgi:hypothetical protein
MRLPGFTAEQALKGKSEIYQGAAIPAAAADRNQGVVPQFFRCWGNYCCNEFGYCIYHGHVLM